MDTPCRLRPLLDYANSNLHFDAWASDVEALATALTQFLERSGLSGKKGEMRAIVTLRGTGPVTVHLLSNQDLPFKAPDVKGNQMTLLVNEVMWMEQWNAHILIKYPHIKAECTIKLSWTPEDSYKRDRSFSTSSGSYTRQLKKIKQGSEESESDMDSSDFLSTNTVEESDLSSFFVPDVDMYESTSVESDIIPQDELIEYLEESGTKFPEAGKYSYLRASRTKSLLKFDSSDSGDSDAKPGISSNIPSDDAKPTIALSDPLDEHSPDDALSDPLSDPISDSLQKPTSLLDQYSNVAQWLHFGSVITSLIFMNMNLTINLNFN